MIPDPPPPPPLLSPPIKTKRTWNSMYHKPEWKGPGSDWRGVTGSYLLLLFIGRGSWGKNERQVVNHLGKHDDHTYFFSKSITTLTSGWSNRFYPPSSMKATKRRSSSFHNCIVHGPCLDFGPRLSVRSSDPGNAKASHRPFLPNIITGHHEQHGRRKTLTIKEALHKRLKSIQWYMITAKLAKNPRNHS